MNYTEYMNSWVKSEALQGKIMIGAGIIILVAFIAILKSEHNFLRGSMIPLGLLLSILIGYGGFILYSRPAHAKQSIAQYEESKAEGIALEKDKHINDNKAGKSLMKIYPILAILAIALLFLPISVYYKGMGLGFALLFLSIYVIDYGFVSRSDAFIEYLELIKE